MMRVGSSHFKSGTLRNVVLIGGLIGTLHLALSLYLWGHLVVIQMQVGREVKWAILGCLPPLLLFVLWTAASWAAWKRRTISGWILAAAFIASVGDFAYDAKTRNWQLHYENYHAEGPQKTFFYFTWWWYDESWLQ
jgi:hypothetical protein